MVYNKSTTEIKLEQNMVMFLQGKKYFDIENYDKAIECFRTVIKHLDPEEANINYSVFHSYLAMAMDKKGWKSYAQSEFQKALKYNPNDFIALKFYNPNESITKNSTDSFNESSITPQKGSFLTKIKAFFQ